MSFSSSSRRPAFHWPYFLSAYPKSFGNGFSSNPMSWKLADISGGIMRGLDGHIIRNSYAGESHLLSD